MLKWDGMRSSGMGWEETEGSALIEYFSVWDVVVKY